MLHRGFPQVVSELSTVLIRPTQVTGFYPALEETEILNWQGFRRLALINFAGCLLLIALLILLATYMQDATSDFIDQSPVIEGLRLLH
jgi:hypothetical protein